MNDLTIRQESALDRPNPKKGMTYIDAVRVIDALMQDASDSRLFGMTSQQAKMVMLTAYELGMTLTGGLRTMYVDQGGRITLRPEGALGLIQSSGLMEKFEWSGDRNSQTITMKRRGRPERHMTLTIQEAESAGWKSAAWKTDPESMLRWRLIGRLAKLDWPDLLLGLSIADDSWMDVEITESGDVRPFVINAPQIAPAPPPAHIVPDYGMSFEELTKLVGLDEILIANNEAYPITPEAINKTIHALIQAGKLVLNDEQFDAIVTS